METYLRVPMEELKSFGTNCLMRAGSRPMRRRSSATT